MRLEAEYFYSVARDMEGTCKGDGSSEFRLSFGLVSVQSRFSFGF